MRNLILISGILLSAQLCFGQIGLCNNDTLFVKDNATVFVQGDFINQHEAFENNGEFTLIGDLENNTDIAEPGTGTFRLNGFDTQNIDLTGEFKTFNLEIDNNDHAIFGGTSDLSVYGDLEFVDGFFYTQQNNLIKFKPNAVYFDASDYSHIDGPAIKEGNTPFRFPVGKVGRLRPIGISETNQFNSYQAEYFREVAPSLLTYFNLEKVSDYEYWNFFRVSGSDDPKLTLTWDETSFLNLPTDDLEIGYTPSTVPWSLVEASTQLPEQFETDLTSNDPIPGYGKFTFATTDSRTIMQDGVLDFELEKFSCTVHVKWSANERSKRVASYTIERQSEGTEFVEVYSIDARNSDNIEDYLFVDRDLDEYETYRYRIVVNYFDETVLTTADKFILASCFPISMTLYPNPVYYDDILTLNVFSEIEKDLEIKVVDVLGRVLQSRVLEIKPGNSKYIIGDTQHYGAAEYFIWTPEIEEIPTLKFQIIR